MAYSTPIAHAIGLGSVTLDTTGADFVTVCVGSDVTTTPTDSKGTLQALTPQNDGAGSVGVIFYRQGGTFGTSHTFNTGQSYRAIHAAAWTGSIATPFDVENGNNAGGSTSITTGSVTPGSNNELVLTAVTLGENAASATINGGFTIIDQLAGVSGVSYGLAVAYLIQTTAASANPTWTYSGTPAASVAEIAAFKAAGGGGGPTITSTSSATPANGSSLTINASGGGFGATQGAGTVAIGGITQTVTAWSDTSITVTVDRGTNKYGASVNVVVQPNTGSPSNSYALTSLQPQSGWSYVDVGTPAADPFTRLTARPDFASGDQVAYDTRGGLVSVAADLTFSADRSVYSWQYEAWSTGSGWSPLATQTMYVAQLADGKVDAEYAALLRRLRKAAQVALDPGSWGGAPLAVSRWFAPELTGAAGGGSSFNITLTASTSTSAAVVRAAASIRSAGQSESAAVPRQVSAKRSASQSSTPTLARVVSAFRSATQAATAALVTSKVSLRTLTATITQSATVTRAASAVRSATADSAATLQRAVSAIRVAATAGAATVVRAVQAVRAASSAQVATLAVLKAKFLTFTASTTMAPALVRAVSSTKSAAQAGAASLLKTAAKVLSAVQAQTGTVSTLKARLLTLAATVGSSATVRRAISAGRASSSAVSAVISKAIGTTRAAASSSSAALLRTPALVRSTSSATTATVTRLRVALLVLAAATAVVGSLRRQVSATRAASSELLVSLAKVLPPRTFTAVQTMVADLQRVFAPAVQVLSTFFAYDVPMAALFYDVRAGSLAYDVPSIGGNGLDVSNT